MKQTRLQNAAYIRNFVFGVEDSLVSTVGLLSGIAVGGVERSQIILTGIVLLFVEAFSMAMGSLLSEQSAQEYLSRKEVSMRASATDSVIMFVSYFLAGLITLAPYFTMESKSALPISIALSLGSLFLLGIVSAKIFGINILKSGIRTLAMGGFAILVGVLVSLVVAK
ncbi:MAG: VIT1/CCC1 transporter family protein [Candidatus Gottesmanbacteria bacterium]|nr:VIT1/CCC1 transporter family protein [Candidatus Gottesmanbacteria bacterium]